MGLSTRGNRAPSPAYYNGDMHPSRALWPALVFLVGALPAGSALGAQAGPQPPPPAKTHTITPQQAKDLFASVDTILRFDSQDSGLPIHHAVKRRLISREQVIAYLTKRMQKDKDTARIERSALVLEKFGMLPPHFQLGDFLLKLLGEQVAGFYDARTKTVNLLNWIPPDEQKPVLAHELMHALQDQYQNARGMKLDDWEDPEPEGTARTATEDREHLRDDETGTAHEAVLEGQAMVTFVDWGLLSSGRTLRTLPDLDPAKLEAATSGSSADSPLLASAPLVLRESLLFPYNSGLVFEQRLLKDRGTQAAFADVLNRPPNTSYEVLNPTFYEKHGAPPLLAMPDLHPLLDTVIDPGWQPYDVGAMGALDVRMLCESLGKPAEGEQAARDWDGGLYYAAQSRTAKTAEQKDDTASLALVYFSRWKTEKAATALANVYRASLKTRYPGEQRSESTSMRTVDQSGEGPIVIEQSGRYAFISQSLAVPTADRVMSLLESAQNGASGADLARGMPGLTAPLRGFFTSVQADAMLLGPAPNGAIRVY
jgi:hypothetical protein